MLRTFLLVLIATATSAQAGTIAAYLAIKDSPVITLDEKARASHVVELPVSRVMTPQEVDRLCGKPDGIRLIPLARIDVDRRVNWYLSADDPQLQLYVIQGDACYEKLDAVQRQLQPSDVGGETVNGVLKNQRGDEGDRRRDERAD